MAFEPVVVATERLLTSHVFDVERVELHAGTDHFVREVVRHRGAVAVLAYDGECVTMVRQWRAPLGVAILEVVAGTCDVEGEYLEATARRELEEEAGLSAAHLEVLCELWNSPGWSDQRTVVFLATGLTAVAARPSGPEEEAIEVVTMPLADAVGVVTSPGASDATTVAAVLALAARLGP